MSTKERASRVPEYGWRKQTALADWLYAEAFRFDFFQAVSLLERMRPECAPVGTGSDPEREAVRFSSTIRLDFPASDIEELRRGEGAEDPARLLVNFFSLAGAEGPLPTPLVELLQDQMRRRDYGARDFLDIFHHRLLSILVRTGRANRPALTLGPAETSAIGACLLALSGLDAPGLRHRQSVPDGALLRYTGRLCRHPRSAAGLEGMLVDYFDAPFHVRQFDGRWERLDPEDRTALGAGGRNQRLGVDAALGARVWTQTGGITLEAGPLTMTQFVDLLPGERGMTALRDLARLYAGSLLHISVRLVLAAAAVQPARLGLARLGWTSWLPSTGPRAQAGRITYKLAG